MKRLGPIGLIAALALALVALAGTSIASASNLKATEYPATISGEQAEEMTLTTNEGTRKCVAPKFTGAGLMEAESRGEFGATPQNTTCSWTFPELAMNGCKLIFHVGSQVEEGLYKGTFDIGPNDCAGITLDGWCKITILPQNGLAASYKNVGSGSSAGVKITAEATKLKYAESGYSCSSKTYENGSLAGAWTTKGETGYGKAGIEVGGNSAEDHYAFLYGDSAASTKRTPDAKSPLVLNAGTQNEVLCNGPGMFEECSTPKLGTAATFKYNSCSYDFPFNDTVAPYNGTFSISCSKPGDSLEINAGLCIYKLSPTSWPHLGSTELTNTGSGSSHQVHVGLGVSGIKYTVQNVFLCPKTGTFENGTLGGGFSISAYDSGGKQVAMSVLD